MSVSGFGQFSFGRCINYCHPAVLVDHPFITVPAAHICAVAETVLVGQARIYEALNVWLGNRRKAWLHRAELKPELRDDFAAL